MTVQILVLAIGMANALALATALWFVPGHRAANRILALLIALLSIRIAPHLLGLADVGIDRRSLAFLPLDFSFAFGPLLWLYIAQLTSAPLSPRWRWHFAPTAVQFVYCAVCFLLPFDLKWAWYSGPHLQWISLVSGTSILASLALYLTLSWQLTTRYRARLDAAFADRDEARLFGVRALLMAFGLAISAAAAATIFMLMAPAHHFDARFPLMLVIVVLTYALGLLGWRNASIVFPPFVALAVPPAGEEASASGANYRTQAAEWRERIRAAEWWRDERLDLAGLAARLGTTPRTLTRVIGEGLDENFRTFIGRVRIEAVCELLDAPDSSASILEIALACGFSSKSSFNRLFLQHRGMSPTAYRAKAQIERLKNGQTSQNVGFGATPG